VGVVDNKSAVYAIFCKKTGKYAIGETKNFKKRSQTHFEQLTTGVHPNQALQADFEKYGQSNFEFVLYRSGSQVENEQVRKSVQDSLIKLANSKKASYTSGLAETIDPRFLGKLPSKAGVFYIYCNKTGRYYYGQTGQTLGIGGRVRSIFAALNRNGFKNTALQQDFLTYGENSFETTAFVFGDAYADELDRVKVVNRLIYNTPSYAGAPNILQTQKVCIILNL